MSDTETVLIFFRTSDPDPDSMYFTMTFLIVALLPLYALTAPPALSATLPEKSTSSKCNCPRKDDVSQQQHHKEADLVKVVHRQGASFDCGIVRQVASPKLNLLGAKRNESATVIGTVMCGADVGQLRTPHPHSIKIAVCR